MNSINWDKFIIDNWILDEFTADEEEEDEDADKCTCTDEHICEECIAKHCDGCGKLKCTCD